LAKALTPVTNAKNLFDDRMPPTFFADLNSAAAKLKEYIATNGKSDSDLMKAFGQIEQANNTLINGIKISYNSFFSPVHTLDAEEQKAATTILTNFKTVETNMPKIIGSINNVTFFVAEKKTARELLIAFSDVLSFIAKKAHKDLTEKYLIKQPVQQPVKQPVKEEPVQQPALDTSDPFNEFPGAKGMTNKYNQSLLILGLQGKPSESEIKKAYFVMSRKWHPDKWSNASKAEQEYASSVFQLIQEAYRYLNL
ncbi:MAG TPA: DnaJ domain-containing protein, partial [Candidatus Babeliales bacterium]|nr:DnaJ domain-containing protein [Candidatus Babeliales bacterium]